MVSSIVLGIWLPMPIRVPAVKRRLRSRPCFGCPPTLTRFGRTVTSANCRYMSGLLRSSGIAWRTDRVLFQERQRQHIRICAREDADSDERRRGTGMDRGTVGSANRGRLQVGVRTEGCSEVVTPVGELDHHTADLLREPLEHAVEQGRVRLVVDCSGLEFCDSTGLNVLLGARLKAEAAGEGSIWPGCCRWWRGSSRSPGPRRSSPSMTPSKRLWTRDRGTFRGPGRPSCCPCHAIRVDEVGVVTIRPGRSHPAEPWATTTLCMCTCNCSMATW